MWLILTAVAAYLLKECRQVSWSEYASAEGKFSVMLPGEPEKMDQSVEYQTGFFSKQSLAFHWAGVDSTIRVRSFDVGYIDFPEDQTNTDYLFNQIGQFVANRYGVKSAVKFTEQTPIELNGYTGRAVTGTYSPGEFVNKDLTVMGRAYYGNKRLYLLIATFKRESTRPDAVKFIESFKIARS
jgi:hypothetical protein